MKRKRSVVPLPAAGRRAAGADINRPPRSAVVLVLLPERQSLLPDGSNVPRGVDQSPVANRVDSAEASPSASAPPASEFMPGIRLQMLRTLRVSAVLLAGCNITLSESDWRGPAGSNLGKDSYECEREARLSVGSGGRETFCEVRSLTEKCMVARGYSKVPAQP